MECRNHGTSHNYGPPSLRRAPDGQVIPVPVCRICVVKMNSACFVLHLIGPAERWRFASILFAFIRFISNSKLLFDIWLPRESLLWLIIYKSETNPWWVFQSVLPTMKDHQAKCLLKHRKLNLYSLIHITHDPPIRLKSKVNLPEESSPAKTFLKLSFMFSKIEIQITNK